MIALIFLFADTLGLMLLPKLAALFGGCVQFWIVRPISVLYRTLRADGSRNDLGVRLALLYPPACDGVPHLCFRTLPLRLEYQTRLGASWVRFQIAENGSGALLRALSKRFENFGPGFSELGPSEQGGKTPAFVEH